MAEDAIEKVRRGHVRIHHLGEGLPTIPDMKDELQGYTDVLLGRVEPPINYGVLTLMVLADGYFARASELSILILSAEREGTVLRNSKMYKFRTGELRAFMEMCKRSEELGSRFLTDEQLRFEQERYGRESRGVIEN